MAPCKSVILTEGLPWVKNIKSNQIKSEHSSFPDELKLADESSLFKKEVKTFKGN